MRSSIQRPAVWVFVLLGWACDSATAPADPNIREFVVQPSPARIGDSVSVSYVVTAARGVAYSEILYEDAASVLYHDSADGGGAPQVSRTLRIPTPSLSLSSWVVKLVVVDQFGRRDAQSTTVHFLTAPTMGGYVTGPDSNPTALPGDTVQFSIGAGVADARDPGITWLGYEVGPPVNARDSLAVSGQQASATMSVVVSRLWITGQSYLPAISFFARDVWGYRIRYSPLCCNVLVVDAIRRPTALVPIAGRVSDVVLDTARNRLYLTQPDSGRILTLSLATMTYGQPILLPGRPSGMDLTLGGDSLLVALFSARELAIMNLITGQIDRVPITLGNPTNPSPDRVREAANGKVLISMTFAGFGYGGELIEHDLRTGQQKRRLDVGLQGALTEATGLARVGDPSRIVLLIEDACCPENAQIYTAATDSFSPLYDVFDLITAPGAPLSSDRAGRYILMGNRLWTSDFSTKRDYARATYFYRFEGPPDASVISSDASEAFFASLYGYYKVRLSNDSTLERVRVALVPNQLSRVFDRIILLPTGQTLVGVGAHGIARIDLR